MKEVKSITWNVKQLKKMFEKGTLRFDSYIQRNECWDLERKSLLVRTMLNGFPRIPEIYATRSTEVSQYSCLDGKQRLTSTFSFVNNEFELSDIDSILDEDENEYELSGKKFEDLSEDMQDLIMSYSFRIAYYDDLSDDDVAELFFLTNNGAKLSTVEHLRALAVDLKGIQKVASHELFKTILTNAAIKKYANEQMVIKTYEMLYKKEPCLDFREIKEVWSTLIITEDIEATITKVYDMLLSTYNILAEDKETKKIGKFVMKPTHFVSILALVRKAIEEGKNENVIAEWIKEFFGTEETSISKIYNEYCNQGSGHTESIRKRLVEVGKSYADFFKDYTPQIEPNEDADVIARLEEVASTVVENDEDKIAEETVLIEQ